MAQSWHQQQVQGPLYAQAISPAPTGGEKTRPPYVSRRDERRGLPRAAVSVGGGSDTPPLGNCGRGSHSHPVKVPHVNVMTSD